MATDHIDDDKLQAYFDRELDEGASKLVARHVAECAECTRSLRRLDRLSTLLARTAEAAADEIDASALFGRVREGIATQGRAGFGERFRVWTSEVIAHRKPVIVSVGGIAAVAAAAILVVLQPFKGGGATSGEGPAKVQPGGGPTTQAAPGTSSVVSYDFGANAGTVFNVNDDSGGEYAVVWIDETPEAGGGSP